MKTTDITGQLGFHESMSQSAQTSGIHGKYQISCTAYVLQQLEEEL